MEHRDRLASQPARTAEPDRFERRVAVALCVGLAVAVCFVYAPASRHRFVNWDDPLYVTENPHVRSGLSWEGLRWAFTQPHAANWHPLTWLSHMLDCQLFGVEQEDAGGHHLVNVALHAANSVFLLVVLRRMTGALWPSALVAALFAVHPLRVESVAWISERKDVLSGFFFMLTLLTYQWFTQRPKLLRYAAVLLSLTLGLLAKPMLVTVPFVLLLLDLWPLRRIQKKGPDLFCRNGPTGASHKRGLTPFALLLEKVPLLAVVTVACSITVSVQRSGGAVASIENVPWTWRLVAAPLAYLEYLGKTIWPTDLAFFYPHPAIFANENFYTWVTSAVAATILLTIVTVALWPAARRWPYLLVGWLWFVGMLVPVIGLMQVGIHFWSDRYAYLPLIGIYLMFAWSLCDLTSRLARTRAIVYGTVCLVLVALAITARGQVVVWRDSQTLCEHALAVTTYNFVAHNNLGNALYDQQRFEEAVAHYQQAIRIKPDYAEAHNSLGNALQGLGRLEEAVAHHQDALGIKPDSAKAHNNCGVALARLERYEEAITHFEKALHIKPDFAAAHDNWGIALQGMGRYADAMTHYQEALRINPDYAQAHYNWGNALGKQGRFEEAVTQYQAALRIKPDHAEAHYHWGNALKDLGRLEAAAAHWQQALSITPNYAEAHNNLGVWCIQQGQFQQAVEHFQHAVRLNPDHADAIHKLRKAEALLLQKTGPAHP